MDITTEIATRVDRLSPEMQEHVLRFVASLTDPLPTGEPGAALLEFAECLDAHSAAQMIHAIEEGCEQLDTGGW